METYYPGGKGDTRNRKPTLVSSPRVWAARNTLRSGAGTGKGRRNPLIAPGVREIVSMPARRPIKPVYIKQFVALIDAAGGIRTK
jgi:hypothetical protein